MKRYHEMLVLRNPYTGENVVDDFLKCTGDFYDLESMQEKDFVSLYEWLVRAEALWTLIAESSGRQQNETIS